MLTMKKTGIPLAVLPNKEMKAIGKAYKNETANLEGVGKLLLYTTALTEAVNVKEKLKNENAGDFESTGIQVSIETHRHLECIQFVRGLRKR